MFDVDDDGVEDAIEFDFGQELLEDAAAAWQHMNRAAGVSKAQAPQALPGPSPTQGRSTATRQFSDDLASSNQQAAGQQDISTSPVGAQYEGAADELPQIHKLLHDNPSCYEDSSKGEYRICRMTMVCGRGQLGLWQVHQSGADLCNTWHGQSTEVYLQANLPGLTIVSCFVISRPCLRGGHSIGNRQQRSSQDSYMIDFTLCRIPWVLSCQIHSD
jgi:hypothetical protein